MRAGHYTHTHTQVHVHFIAFGLQISWSTTVAEMWHCCSPLPLQVRLATERIVTLCCAGCNRSYTSSLLSRGSSLLLRSVGTPTSWGRQVTVAGSTEEARHAPEPTLLGDAAGALVPITQGSSEDSAASPRRRRAAWGLSITSAHDQADHDSVSREIRPLLRKCNPITLPTHLTRAARMTG